MISVLPVRVDNRNDAPCQSETDMPNRARTRLAMRTRLARSRRRSIEPALRV